MAKISITLKRSPIARPSRQGAVAKALGLKKLGDTVVHEDTPPIRGMINRISHLLEVKPL